MAFTLEFDWSEYLEGLRQFGGSAAGHAMGTALFEEGETIIGDSKEKFVPVDLGPLRASGHTQQPVITASSVEVKIGFGGPSAPYAAAVHENPRAGKTGGRSPQGKKYKHFATTGSWKFLEFPLNEARNGFVQRVGKRFWEIVGAGH